MEDQVESDSKCQVSISKEKIHKLDDEHDLPCKKAKFEETENRTINSPFQTEKNCGITEYLSNENGFYGILKHRYSDFVVNEIQKDGTVIHLTDFSAPKEDANIISLTEQVGLELSEKIQHLCSQDADKSDPVLIDVTEMDKDKRRKIHTAIRQNCTGLESNTEDQNDKKFIAVTKANAKQKGRRSRPVWPHSRGNYTHFVLYKENTDTMEAIYAIANLLRMPTSAFTFAGTKDKRGKTTQMVSVYRVAANKLLDLNGKLKNIKVGNIQYKNMPIKLGDLFGNHFSIILREITGSEEEIKKAMESFTDVGFINYYGLQRFGTTSVPTYEIGRALLEGKWDQAIDLILKPRSKDSSEPETYRKIWAETKDPKAALEHLKKKGSAEGHLLRGLISHSLSDMVNSLNAIPRNTRLMYVHSFQSYIWNQIASFRIKEYGLKPIIGDLVLPHNIEVSTEEEKSEEQLKSFKDSLKMITDKDQNLPNMYDIVLPLPGNSVTYPDNKVCQKYKELLEKQGLNFSSFTSKVKTYSLGGDYRHLIVKPRNVQWAVINYSDPTQSLLLSDLDRIQEITLPESIGERRALKIEFSLPVSSYATMAIREILKIETTSWRNSLEQ
ncbi:pseudouridylate synthase 7 homolog [Centruroides sculpturatus]|uniref:pseudouridylate synthase 7 homolog n=1 Tax=Centruroides sculpturatus TaxID=218467 RepID=UPI000C6EB3E1|nr:pseudouridylate synthase 7 homolog [Centruroides sculpturatus]